MSARAPVRWTPDARERVYTLYSERVLSGSAIARTIRAEFGLSVSASSVIGLAYRAGLSDAGGGPAGSLATARAALALAPRTRLPPEEVLRRNRERKRIKREAARAAASVRNAVAKPLRPVKSPRPAPALRVLVQTRPAPVQKPIPTPKPAAAPKPASVPKTAVPKPVRHVQAPVPVSLRIPLTEAPSEPADTSPTTPARRAGPGVRTRRFRGIGLVPGTPADLHRAGPRSDLDPQHEEGGVSDIGVTDVAEYPPYKPSAEADDWDAAMADLRKRGLPVPERRVPQIAAERLDMEALWRSLSDADRERIGLIGLGLVVGGTMSMEAERTAPAASRAALGFYHAVEEELATMEVPEAIFGAMRGPSWWIPSGLGPVCLSCGCSEGDACPGGCGWADEACMRCTECANPRPLPF